VRRVGRAGPSEGLDHDLRDLGRRRPVDARSIDPQVGEREELSQDLLNNFPLLRLQRLLEALLAIGVVQELFFRGQFCLHDLKLLLSKMFESG
jgi:hypothetical protein